VSERVLVVDDDLKMRTLVARVLSREGYVVRGAETGQDALNMLDAWNPDLMLCDIRMPGMDGMELLGRVQEAHPELPVVVMTGFGSVETAVEAMRAGAFDYFSKPFDLDELLIVVRKAVEHLQLRRELADLRKQVPRAAGFVGKSKAIQNVLDWIARAAPSDATVVIYGKSGTGKELVARAIHRESKRASGPFVPVNCAAIPESLIESELFGHAKGSFTGAVREHPGLFVEAAGGTLFLDEIGELPLAMQAKLLRALQDGEIRAVGKSESVKVNTRLVAATNRDLEADVKAGRFRDDLYYRLSVIPIHLPALNERPEDIPLLAVHFLERFASGGEPKRLTKEALRALERYSWPGNVRELENIMERACALVAGPEIGLEDLPEKLQSTTTPAQETLPLTSLAETEYRLITSTLRHFQGHLGKSADALGIHRRTLSRKIREYRQAGKAVEQ
jgi:two-component system response regulator HydG